jgi:cell division septation protein DedD
MKASPNREQQLFLITGGVILLLILAVVIFNMVRSPTKIVEEEETQRPMVKLTDKLGRTGRYAPGGMGTAAVFGNHDDDKALNFESIKPRAIRTPEQGELPPDAAQNNSASYPATSEPVLGGQTPDERLTGGWNRSPSDLEATRHEIALKLEEKKRKAAQLEEKKRKAAQLEEKKRKAAQLEEEKRRAAEPPPPPPVQSAKVAPKKVEPIRRLVVKKVQAPTGVKKRTEPVADFSQAIADMVKQNKQLARKSARQPIQAPVVERQPVAPRNPASTKWVKPPPVVVSSRKPAPSTKSSVTTKNGYSVQIASLSSPARAQALQEKLRSFMLSGKRLPVYQGTAVVGSKTYYRVRLGPFTSRTQAEKAERLIQSQTGMAGRLIKPSGP